MMDGKIKFLIDLLMSLQMFQNPKMWHTLPKYYVKQF